MGVGTRETRKRLSWDGMVLKISVHGRSVPRSSCYSLFDDKIKSPENSLPWFTTNNFFRQPRAVAKPCSNTETRCSH